MSKHVIHNSKFVEWAEAEGMFDDSKFHAVLCDPPYGLEFMGKEWDKFDIRQPGDPTLPVSNAGPFRRAKVRHAASPGYGKAKEAKQGFQEEVKKWGEALLPLLYPGALVFMFGGPRMWHRLATGMEDAGFHLWDTMMWLYGQGFPKAHDLSEKCGKDWTGFKTPQLKPAWEPILCFKAPADNTYVELATQYGSGCLNVDGGRIEYQSEADKASATPQGTCTAKSGSLAGKVEYPGCDDYAPDTLSPTESDQDICTTCFYRGVDHKPRKEFERPKQTGRYPSNLILDGDSAAMLDSQTGTLTSGKSKPEYRKKAKNNVYGTYANDDMPINVIGDSGGTSRFFYCSKASQKERGAGLEGKNTHPTVKPVDLNKWLASLLLPPSSVQNRRLLIPFSGSGSEMIGAMLAGWDEVVGIEMNAEYCKIAEQRIQHWKTDE